MTALSHVLAALRGHDVDAVLVAGDPSASVLRVVTTNALSDLPPGADNALLALDHTQSPIAVDYEFDVLIRRAVDASFVGVTVLAEPDSRFSPTALRLAEKQGLAVVRLDPATSLSQVIEVVVQLHTDSIYEVLHRASSADLTEIELESTLGDLSTLVAMISRKLQRQVTVALEHEIDTSEVISVPALLTDDESARLATARTGSGATDEIVERTLWKVAARYTALAHARRERDTAEQLTVAEVLLQLISPGSAHSDTLLRTAQRLGFRMSAWYVVVHMEFEESLNDEVVAYARRARLAEVLRATARRVNPACHVTHDASGLVLLWVLHRAPAAEDAFERSRAIQRVLDELVEGAQELGVFCGVGTARPGLTGIEVSAAEAKLASQAARLADTNNIVREFDLSGLRPLLIEWAGSPRVRQRVNALFAPLDALPAHRREPLLETLGTYLDNQGSIGETSKMLHLHRNSVRYRLTKVLELLRVNIDEPETRLFLQLACHVRRQ